MPYTIEEHIHRFAAWAAGRASSVKGCRFSIEQGRSILEKVGLRNLLSDPNNLPSPEDFNAVHRRWRQEVINASREYGLLFTHGVAAKLINTYLKVVFVCGGYHRHKNVQAIHPPIDSVLLDELFKENFGGLRKEWNKARQTRWSKFNSEQYETVIRNIRNAIQGKPLWMAEQFWKGYR